MAVIRGQLDVLILGLLRVGQDLDIGCLLEGHDQLQGGSG